MLRGSEASQRSRDLFTKLREQDLLQSKS